MASLGIKYLSSTLSINHTSFIKEVRRFWWCHPLQHLYRSLYLLRRVTWQRSLTQIQIYRRKLLHPLLPHLHRYSGRVQPTRWVGALLPRLPLIHLRKRIPPIRLILCPTRRSPPTLFPFPRTGGRIRIAQDAATLSINRATSAEASSASSTHTIDTL